LGGSRVEGIKEKRVSEGGERPKNEDGKDIPEVEAELVQETAPAADAFDDAAPACATAPDTEPDAPAPRKTGLTTGLTPGVVLFILFSLAAVGVFAYWRFQERPAAREDVAAGEPTPTAPAEETAPPEQKPAPAQEADAENKIANAAPDGMKWPDAPPQADSGAEAAKPEGFLPPVGAAGAAKLSNEIEDGAKEAMLEFQEKADAAETAAAPPSVDIPSTDSIDRFEIEDPALAKIDNDLEGLKQEFAAEAQRLEAALIEERQRNADQAAEISALRAELSAALAARDQAVEEERAALRAEMEKISNEDVKISTQHMKASFALAALTRAVDQGDPYTEELAAISQFDPAAAATLTAQAETGVATEAALRERFPAAARAALAAAGQEQAGGGVSGLVARAASVISVRPASPQAGDTPGAVLSRAEHALGQGETAFALLQLEDLPMSAQTAMADWIADARARAEAEAALAALQSRLVGERG
jgi:hypothetical protein